MRALLVVSAVATIALGCSDSAPSAGDATTTAPAVTLTTVAADEAGAPGASSATTTDPPAGATTTPGTAEPRSVFDLVPGDCVQDPDEPSAVIELVEVVDCAEPHDNEVFALVELAEQPFPGQDEVDRESVSACETSFEELGAEVDAAGLTFGPLTPSEVTWSDGDREAVCLLWSEDLSPLVGSVVAGDAANLTP